MSRRTRKVNNRASTTLRLAAWAAGLTDPWIGRFCRRVKARRGAPKAVTATARKLACVIHHLLKYLLCGHRSAISEVRAFRARFFGAGAPTFLSALSEQAA